jgi:hypothetical protein
VRSFRFLAGLVAIGLGSAPACFAQAADTKAPIREFTFDVAPVGLNVGFAARTSAHQSFGASLGVGGNWLNYMVLGGSHFAASNGLSYETRDGATNKALYELARASVFVRTSFEHGRQLDVGLKAAAFLHSDSSDDDPGGGLFAGLNVTGMWWQFGRVRLGSELDAGMFTEGHPELGIKVAPILLRISVP